MFPPALIIAFVAANTVIAAPAPEPNLDALADGEVHVFKRDAPLSPRDLELAEMHQVNLTEMFKHSVMKRDDGDHFTVWVERSYVEAEGPALDKRNARPVNHSPSGDSNTCRAYTYDDLMTSEASPWTGGAQSIARWGENNQGSWIWTDEEGNARKTLIIGGSNGGNNARFVAEMGTFGLFSSIGTTNVGELTRGALSNWQRHTPSGWRVAGRGTTRCDSWIMDFPLYYRDFQWWVVSTDEEV